MCFSKINYFEEIVQQSITQNISTLFYSYNYPDLAKVGINIHYNDAVIRDNSDGMFSINTNLDMNIAILKLFPGINKQTVDAILNIEGLRAVVMETYGAGKCSN